MTSLETVLTCTPCGHTVDLREEECKVVAFFTIPGGGMRMEVGCAHVPINHIEQAVAVTVSETCARQVIDVWLTTLKARHA